MLPSMQPITLGPAPGLVHRVPAPRGTLFLLHGQGADAVANAKELALVAGAGWNVVGIDAPDHGRRFDPERDARFETDAAAELERHLDVAAAEFPAILDGAVAAELDGPYAVAGISLGAFTTWRILALDPRVRIGLPILGSPCLPGHPTPDASPWSGVRVLAQNAEHDEVVPLQPTLDVVEAIDADVHVMADSPHRVPELQWWAAWGRAVRWLSEQV